MARRILIVDDTAGSRETMATLLRMEGYEAVSARNGVEGLAKLKEQPTDLVLLDHMMPEVDGLTFLAGIRRFPKWKNLPVIMFTAVKDGHCVNKARSLGVAEYLVKANYSMKELLEFIQRHMPADAPAPAN